MSGPRIYFAPNRLAEALSRAAPRTVTQGLRQADENLKKLAPECADHVDRTLAQLEGILGNWPDRPDPAYLNSIYDASLSLIGAATIAGLPAMDFAAKSLCDVIDGLTVRNLWERDPVVVHVQALRLLRQPASREKSESGILDGLMRVRLRFAVENALPSPACPDAPARRS